MLKLITIDDLMYRCGYDCDSDEGNGFGCDHPEADEGKCLKTNCPIAWPASFEDMTKYDAELAKEYEYQIQNGKDPEESLDDSDWMVWDDESDVRNADE